MFLPMMGFSFVLIVVGSLALLIATVNRRSPPLSPKPLIPYVGFICMFSGLGAFSLSMGLGALGESILKPNNALTFLGFFAGYVLGGLGGAALGFKLASNPKWRS